MAQPISHGRLWHRRMAARNPQESHRVSTPLELFFDLIFVVAVGQAAAGLEHLVAGGHYLSGVISYGFAFFAIWWAWMNFTWFASAFDIDDGPYRLLVMLQMSGALVMAAGLSGVFEGLKFAIPVIGYVLMRLAMVAQWLRVAASAGEHRGVALRYAAGITVAQIYWVVRLAFPVTEGITIVSLLIGVAAEMSIPVWAEHRRNTPWHAHHLAERYGLFTIIVLGESITAATLSVQAAVHEGIALPGLYVIAGFALVVVFSMWWLYFDKPRHITEASLPKAILWGYGHLLIFAAVAATGAGIQVVVQANLHPGHIPETVAGMAIAIPVAGYLVGLWVLHIIPWRYPPLTVAYPVAIAAVAVTPWLPAPVIAIAVVLAALVGFTAVLGHRKATASQ